ncbi:MAG: hypothetical protein KDC35_21590 [Acidobacteria bacterium]|nr:hypothetical protein [Acidobacteriota bacterium]
MNTLAQFQVEYVMRVQNVGVFVFAHRCDNEEFWINESAKLNGCSITHGDIPRAFDERGNPRLDIWAFLLKNEGDVRNFSVGDVVYLESSKDGN